MKKFFSKNGFGYMVVFAAFVTMILCGAAMLFLGVYGWFTGENDIMAAIGMGVGFLAICGGTMKIVEMRGGL